MNFFTTQLRKTNNGTSKSCYLGIKIRFTHFQYLYTFPEFIIRNHMLHENEAILRKSMSDERK